MRDLPGGISGIDQAGRSLIHPPAGSDTRVQRVEDCAGSNPGVPDATPVGSNVTGSRVAALGTEPPHQPLESSGSPDRGLEAPGHFPESVVVVGLDAGLTAAQPEVVDIGRSADADQTLKIFLAVGALPRRRCVSNALSTHPLSMGTVPLFVRE